MSVCGLKTRTKPSSDEQHLGREVEHREDDVEARRLADADDVDARPGSTITIAPPTMSQGFSCSGAQKIER